ncbi:MAG TPA: tetratricopeptide repeat protein [Acidobacteriota bacterium]|nr:tetratricopeptide repeat protein [Acidobacteriota bacterium]
MTLRAFILCFLLMPALAAQSVQDYAQQARQMNSDGEPVAALKVLRQGLAAYPDDLQLLEQCGVLLLDLGQASAAAQLFQRALQLDPQQSRYLRRLAEARLMLGDLEEARELLQKVVEGENSSASAHRNLAYSLLMQGEEGKALKQIRLAVDKDPSNANYRRFYAQILDQRGDSESSLRQLKIAFRLAPRDARLMHQISSRLESDGRYGGAMEFIELALEADGENPLYHRKAALLYDRLGQTERAIRHANLERRLGQAFEDYQRAVEIVSQGRNGEAIAFLEESLAEVPEFLTGRLYLAGLYQKRGRSERALELYQEVLKANPAEPMAREQSAWLRMEAGDSQGAVEMLRTGEQSPNSDFFEGYRLLQEQDWDGAIEVFQQLRRRYPLNSDLLQLISFALEAKGKRRQAEDYLEKAETLQPDSQDIREQQREVRFRAADQAMRKGRVDEAAQLFEALAAAPDSRAEDFFNAAWCRQRMGHLDAAIGHYRNGLRMQPEARWARLNLATSLYLRMRYAESLTEWERLVRSDSPSVVHFQMGMCYSHLSRLAEAEVAFTRAQKLGDHSPALLYNLGLTRFRLGRMQQGIALIRASARFGYGPAVSFNRRIGNRRIGNRRIEK